MDDLECLSVQQTHKNDFRMQSSLLSHLASTPFAIADLLCIELLLSVFLPGSLQENQFHAYCEAKLMQYNLFVTIQQPRNTLLQHLQALMGFSFLVLHKQ